MAFENVKLTATQREELYKMKIKNPYGSFNNITEGIKPMYLTVNHDTGTWLAWCYTHHDTSEDIEEFIFMYKSNPIPIQAIQKINEKQVCWKISRVDMPKDLIGEKEKILDELVAAFKAYSVSGWSGEENETVEVVCNYKL